MIRKIENYIFFNYIIKLIKSNYKFVTEQSFYVVNLEKCYEDYSQGFKNAVCVNLFLCVQNS
jgi:hypothetical protein